MSRSAPPTLFPSRKTGFWGWVARTLCVLFGSVGALPVALLALSNSAAFAELAARHTASLVERLLGVHATYTLKTSAWPLAVELQDVSIAATDGGSPALTADLVRLQPPLLDLLGGQLDAGDVLVDNARVRLVVDGQGQLSNVVLHLPKSDSGRDLPLRSLRLAGLDLDLVTPVGSLELRELLLDVQVNGPELGFSLRASRTKVQSEGPSRPSEPTKPTHDDVLCGLQLDGTFAGARVSLSHFAVSGWLDTDPTPDSGATCALPTLEPSAADRPKALPARLSASGLELSLEGTQLHSARGTTTIDVPLELLDRYWIPERLHPLTGPVQLTGDFAWTRGQFPVFRGSFHTGHLTLRRVTLARAAQADVVLEEGAIRLPRLYADYAEGKVTVDDVSLLLTDASLPLRSTKTLIVDVNFPGLMRDVHVTPNTIIGWDFPELHVENFSGTLIPLNLAGQVDGDTKNFLVFDKAFHRPDRQRRIGVQAAHIATKFIVHARSLEFANIDARFGQSRLLGDVQLGFDGHVGVNLLPTSRLDLADISPLVQLPIAGRGQVEARLERTPALAKLTGKLDIQDFMLFGFPLGRLQSDNVEFIPLHITAPRVTLDKGGSQFVLANTRLAFDAGASVVAEAKVVPSGVEIRDFLSLFSLDRDPRWQELAGTAQAQAELRYVFGGPEDRCGSGDLRVGGEVGLSRLELFGERYHSGRTAFTFHWFDPGASFLGFELKLPNFRLSKGTGDLLGSFTAQREGQIQGSVAAHHVPLSSMQALGPLAPNVTGELSGVGRLSGSLEAIAASFQGALTPVGVRGSALPASSLNVRLEPIVQKPRRAGTTQCGLPRPAPFDAATYEQDLPSGEFSVNGELFGGQVRLAPLRVSQQRARHVRGTVVLSGFSPTPLLAGLRPPDNAQHPELTLDGKLDLGDLPLAAPARTQASFALSSLRAHYGAFSVINEGETRLEVADGQARASKLALRARGPNGASALVDVQGSITDFETRPELAITLNLRPTPLAAFSSLVPQATRVEGTLGGSIALQGPLADPQVRGSIAVTEGGLLLRGNDEALRDLQLRLELEPEQIRLSRGHFRYGTGRVELEGEAPLSGLKLGEVRLALQGRGLVFAPTGGVRLVADADLNATWDPSAATAETPALPRVTGTVALDEASYSRPVKMSVSLTELAQRRQHTDVDAYQPENDLVRFDVVVHANQPLRLSNNLIDARLTTEDDPLRLVGTNQRFGLLGGLRVLPGGRLTLRRHEFEIQAGRVRFDDVTRISPAVDVTAVTQHHRYSAQLEQSALTLNAAQGNAAGDYRVTLRARGNADALQVDLSSDPPLSQEDIFLLLTLGLTRTELDQVQQAGGGGNVALEALGAITGADQAVTDAIGVVDEFRFGSAYSARTGRTEPTITLSKRLSDRLRALLTTGLSEAREVRSNVEVRLNSRVSVEGSYDNVNSLSSSSLGNLGADLRWRLRFE
jgi:translocation and assembly module TamB